MSKKRKYIHPEKLFGTGCSNRDKVINFLGDFTARKDEESLKKVEALALSLPIKDRQFLQYEVDKSKSDQIDKDTKKYPLKESEAYKLKQLDDIKTAYPNGKVPTYKISKGFYECVKRLDRSLPSKFLDTQANPLYFHFPHYVSDFEGAYVDVIMNKKFTEEEDKDAFCLRLVLCHKDYSVHRNEIFIFFFTGDMLVFDELVNLPIEASIGSERFIKEVQNASKSFYTTDSSITKRKEILLGVLNSLIYIKSKDPEIEKLRPVKLYSNKEFSKLESSKQESLCTIPVNLVGWSYHGKLYTKGSTMVAPHFRWQPCGEGRKYVKLIMVKEHERKYNKVV